MGRYFSDHRRAAVWAEVTTRTQWAAEQEKAGWWITYLIRDPRYPDKKGQPGLPIYIGQTKEFAKRVLSRFTSCEREAMAKGKDCVERRVADLLHLDMVAQYQVLSYQPTYLSSLVDETNMARECRRRGYDIANHAAMQNEAGPPITRHQIPKDWLWDRFSLDEAEQDNIEVELLCSACRSAARIPVGRFRTIERPPRDLKAIKIDPMWKREPCSQCGQSGGLSVHLYIP
jgi:hypothetical protein